MNCSLTPHVGVVVVGVVDEVVVVEVVVVVVDMVVVVVVVVAVVVVVVVDVDEVVVVVVVVEVVVVVVVVVEHWISVTHSPVDSSSNIPSIHLHLAMQPYADSEHDGEGLAQVGSHDIGVVHESKT